MKPTFASYLPCVICSRIALLSAIVVLAATMPALSGCGQKGPLFMPVKAAPVAATLPPGAVPVAPALPLTPAPVTPQSPAMTPPAGLIVPSNK